MSNASPQALVDAIAGCWPDLASKFSTPQIWQTFSAELLQLLRELDDLAADRKALAAEIIALFAKHPAANEVLEARLSGLPDELDFESAEEEGLGSPWSKEIPDAPAKEIPTTEGGGRAASAPSMRHTLISVLYGTDRTPLPSQGLRAQYSAERADELSFGIATVSIPDDHRMGKVERPRWYRLEFRENPEKHVVALDISPLTRSEFVKNVKDAAERDGSIAEALVFVHGYKVGFEDSLLRTAQIACDLNFRGTAIAYSWPSKERVLGYGADANTAGSSMFMLAEFIKIIRSELGFQKVHVIAHSMGSRLLAGAMDRIALAPAIKPCAAINQVVFAAPDIDPKTFGQLARAFTQSCERCTLYASSRDMALFAAKLVYRSPRAGDISASAMITHGVDTIDATNVDTSLLGHSYFGDRRTILADLYNLFAYSHGPEKRHGLREIPVPGGRYWQFVP